MSTKLMLFVILMVLTMLRAQEQMAAEIFTDTNFTGFVHGSEYNNRKGPKITCIKKIIRPASRGWHNILRQLLRDIR